MKIILSPTEERFKEAGFHRKRTGLNHLALNAQSRQAVDTYVQVVLKENGIPTLYQEGADGNDHYYSVLFEDPDRMKIEVVWAPHYCEKLHWPNTIPSDFDPYAP
jgi:predicted lactoylglutathione lyase